MPVMQEVINRLAAIDTRKATLKRGDFEASAHAGGSGESVILSHKARQPFSLRNGARYRVVPVARETFTTDGNGGNTETFNLSHDIIDSDVSEDLVVFNGNAEAQPDSIDYANDSFDFTDAGTNNDLTVFYVAATQAQLKLKKVAPGGSNSETLVEHDAALINRRDPNRDPLEFALGQSPVQGTVPTDWRLEWSINGPFNAGWDPDNDPAPVNMIVSVPIHRATVSEVDGLGSVVANDSSNRV
jgi:hypothetical protein